MIPKKEEILVNAGGEIAQYQPFSKTAFWGVAPTGDIHIGYLPYIAILKQLKKEGYKIILFIGDYHAYLDANKCRFDDLSKRSEYYYNTFQSLGIDKHDIYFGHCEYLNPQYLASFFEFANFIPSSGLLYYADKTLENKKTGNYKFGDLLYVATQIFDVKYFKCDLILCGIDESGIYKYGLPIIEEIINCKISYMYMPMVSGVIESEMHASSIPANKISVHESLQSMTEKLNSNISLCNDIANYILPLWDINFIDKANTIKQLCKICACE